jgi:hypothetical protein
MRVKILKFFIDSDYNDYFVIIFILIIICGFYSLIRKCLENTSSENSSENEDQERILDDYFNNQERRFVVVHPIEM